MKTLKAIAIASVAVISLAFTSCGNNASTTETTTDNDTTAVAEVVEATEGVIELTADYTVPETLDRPMIIDFSATWCAPCQQFKPVFHNVAEKYAGKATFATADVDVCTALSEKFGVASIPYIVAIRPDGKVLDLLGMTSEEDFIKFVEKALAD